MTSLLHHNHRRRGFTLVETLVVMGIILVLIAILLPAVNKAHKEATRTRMAADLQTISEGLGAYRDQFGDYPRCDTNTPVDGSVILCWALVAPGPSVSTGSVTKGFDGADGPGFRIRGTQGTVYGPLINVDRFKIGPISNGIVTPPTGNAVYDDTTSVIGDYYDHPILYFPRNREVDPSKGYVGNFTRGTTPTPNGPNTANAMYNYQDNSSTIGQVNSPVRLTQKAMAYKMGAHKPADYNPNPAVIKAKNDVAITTGPYILWSAGPDGIFGPQVDTNGDSTGIDDDVTYPVLDTIPVGFKP